LESASLHGIQSTDFQMNRKTWIEKLKYSQVTGNLISGKQSNGDKGTHQEMISENLQWHSLTCVCK